MALFDFLLGREPKMESNGHNPKFGVEVPLEIVRGDKLAGLVRGRISRQDALEVPAVLRSRNLIAGTLSTLPIHIRDREKRISKPTTLLDQIDPDVPNVVTLANTYEDLLFEGISWWRVLDSGFHGYPTFATHVPVMSVTVHSGRVFIDGVPVPDSQVIRFDSPNPPLLVHGARAIRTCLLLDKTASLYADNPTALGYFTPKEGIPDPDEDTIEGILSKWAQNRRLNAWGYVSAALEAKKLQFDAEQIQLAEQRQHAVLEIARAAGVDPEDLGVSTTSRTYQNAETRRQDLLIFTLSAYVAAMEQRLSMRDIIPRGHEAKVNFDAFLRSDTLTRMKTYEIGIPLGVTTEDEARDLEDRPPLSDSEREQISRSQPQPMETVDD